VKRGVLAAQRPRRILAWLLLALVATGWLWLQAYQSHYESGLRALGDRQAVALLGEPKSGRGDEWSTYLPMLKQAQREGFPARSNLEPYRERLDWFITLPHAGASLVLLPNQAAWWIATPGVALSFQGLYYNLLLLLSVCWLMRNLRVGTGLAVATGVVLLFSHLYQAWWTSNFACLGASILPFAVLTSPLRWRYRGPLLAWSIGHMLLGQLYPPFYFALAVAVLPFVAAARPDLLQWRNLAWATASVAAGCAAALYLKLGYIEAVAGTAYPGSRFSMGGDTSASTLVSVLFPTWPAVPAPGVGLAFYELGMAASFFPLLAIAALPTVAWTREVRRVAIVSVLVGAVLAFYMVSGFPPALAKLTGFSMAPGRRIQLGFSVLALFLSVYLVSRTRAPIRPGWLLAVLAAHALASILVGVQGDAASQFRWYAWYPWLGLALACVAGLAALGSGHGRKAGNAMTVAVVAGMSLAHVAIFGSFNPLMRASDIMRPVDTQLVRDWKALHRMNHGQPLAVDGNYGHLLRGEGLEALQAIHLVNVDDDTYARVFPELAASERRKLFNRFVGIGFDNVPRRELSGLGATFPDHLHSVAFPHAIDRDRRGALALNAPVDVAVVEQVDAATYVVYWNSGLRRPLPIAAQLVLHPACEIRESWLTRYPRPGPLLAPGMTSLRGIAGRTVVAAQSREEAMACVRGFMLSSPDGIPVSQPVPLAGEGADIRAGLAWSGRACDLAVVDGSVASRETPSLFEGYAIAPSNTPAGRFWIVLAGPTSLRMPATTGVRRPDVAGFFDAPALELAGFRVAVDFSSLPAGAYSVEFHGREAGQGWFCETGKTIVVPP